ncbi:MAG: SDR family NAD(P)-dependent oxidoreductase [Candidatus Bathyarchaeia archaeon]
MSRRRTRSVVTGGAGFIGSHIVDRLVAEGSQVRVIDNLSKGKLTNIQQHVESSKVEFVKGDIRDAGLVVQALRDTDTVFHLAAITNVSFSFSNPELTFDVNVGGTVNLLTAAVEANVPRFVFVSTCAVYGDPTQLPVKESNLVNPLSPYSESMLTAERFCMGFHEEKLLKSAVFRLFNVYGPRQDTDENGGVIPKFLDHCEKGLPLTIYGDGSQTRDFVHVFDVARSIVAASRRSDAYGQVFNLGNGKPTSVKELAEAILKVSRRSADLVFLDRRPGEVNHMFADTDKARRLLGYRPSYALRDGLQTMIEEYREREEMAVQ